MIRYDKDTNTITMVAKDTGVFAVKVTNYLLDQGDKVYFTVNSELENEDALISKEITEFNNNKAIVKLTSLDTDIPVGKYYYDIEIDTADGRVDTVLGPCKFKVVGGVKY